MMMNWDGLDDDEFFESADRISCAVPMDMADEDYDDSRMSFASAIGAPPEEFRAFAFSGGPPAGFGGYPAPAASPDYNIWMAQPGSIRDRRQRLLQGMGLASNKELLKVTSTQLKRVASVKPAPPEVKKKEPTPSPPSPPASPPTLNLITRSKSEGCIVSSYAVAKCRENDIIDADTKHRLLRLHSIPMPHSGRYLQLETTIKPFGGRSKTRSRDVTIGRVLSTKNSFGGGFLIKNLDTGNVFLINEDGTTSSLSDLQTGKQLSMEEFEKSVGQSPLVKELMRRENVDRESSMSIVSYSERKIMSMNATLTKSFRSTKKKGPAWLKNIRGMANSINGLILDKEKEQQAAQQSSSKWTKVHQHGKSHKELTGLYMCQEIQAHEGSIWCIKFSLDARYLASAGEDRVIHIWEVVDCDVLTGKAVVDEANSTPVHPLASKSIDHPTLADAPMFPSKKRGKAKSRRIPDYVTIPENVFSLSDKPVCTFEGHQDDVLDLSWSRSQQLLSSSMDKTVRLWDMESNTCLKLFAHNDYVTCIQFNPTDETYFISGSLDAKVRIWDTVDRKVVDWTDLHEMVTAVCYTPDGQGALVGSHKGSCRMYDTSDCKLSQTGQVDVQTKKKSQAKKVTGFQFAPGNSSEVLITSADSRIRIFDGTDISYKFRGFRNTNSQISASFTNDGKYVVSASEDSQVYVWKRDEIHNTSGGKSKGLITTQSYERFQCRDVSVAIPWPGSIKYDPSIFSIQSKRHSKNTLALPPPSPGSSSLPPPSPASSTLPPPSPGSISLPPPSPGHSSHPEGFLKSPSTSRSLPPLPRKNSIIDKAAICTEEGPSSVSRTDSVSGDNTSLDVVSRSSSLVSARDSPSISASDNAYSSLSWLFDGGSSRSKDQGTAAWGLVIVTAGQGGELRIYQNFGLPVRVGRQATLFRDYGSIGSSTNKRFP